MASDRHQSFAVMGVAAVAARAHICVQSLPLHPEQPTALPSETEELPEQGAVRLAPLLEQAQLVVTPRFWTVRVFSWCAWQADRAEPVASGASLTLLLTPAALHRLMDKEALVVQHRLEQPASGELEAQGAAKVWESLPLAGKLLRDPSHCPPEQEPEGGVLWLAAKPPRVAQGTFC